MVKKNGCCPKCSNRISLFQAARYGANVPIICGNCKNRICKTDARRMTVILAVIPAMAVYLQYGVNNILTWLTYIVLCMYIAFDAQYKSPMALFDEKFRQ